MSRKCLAQTKTGIRDHSNTAPIRVINFHDGIELLARSAIAARPDDFGVAIIEMSSTCLQLVQYGVHGGQQGIGSESGNGRRKIVFFNDELPLLRAHYGRNMTRRNQCVETWRT